MAKNGWIVLAEWTWTGSDYELNCVKAAKVGGPEGIRAGIVYRLNKAGEFVEVEGASP